MNPALKPSAKHYLQYDAATFENEGFKTLNGRISQLALEPRFWSVSVKVITSDLRDQVKREVLDKDDYLPVCTQCLVTARVMM